MTKAKIKSVSHVQRQSCKLTCTSHLLYQGYIRRFRTAPTYSFQFLARSSSLFIFAFEQTASDIDLHIFDPLLSICLIDNPIPALSYGEHEDDLCFDYCPVHCTHDDSTLSARQNPFQSSSTQWSFQSSSTQWYFHSGIRVHRSRCFILFSAWDIKYVKVQSDRLILRGNTAGYGPYSLQRPVQLLAISKTNLYSNL